LNNERPRHAGWKTALLFLVHVAAAAEKPAYSVTSYVPPSEVKLEVSGVTQLPDGRIAVAVRKGEVWLLERPDADPSDAAAVGYKRIASGLHEPHGLLWHNGSLLAVQRAELTRLSDLDGDDLIDEYACAVKGWGVSGGYHEYAYGPALDGGGNLWITLNTRGGRTPMIVGHRTTENPWRGWAMRLTPGGELEPMCAGLRSPSGFGANAEGDMFCTDQQGPWWGTNPILHLRRGAFLGHKDALKDVRRAGSPVRDPGELPKGITVAEAIRRVPGYAPPAVWLPYAKMGQSPTAIAFDLTGGKFGPFAGQLFVGEFVLSGVNRVFLEKVGGEYQGAAIKFVGGLECGAVSMAFLRDGSLIVGETNRGWNSQGTRSFGLERVRWMGSVPFEIRTMRARPDGFVLEFTQPVDPTAAGRGESYTMKSYTYLYHEKYGSPEIDPLPVKVVAATVSDEGKTVRLRCEGLREGYVHELVAEGVRSASQAPLAHPAIYYTLNRRPTAE
jgi:hypothetical protein